jgi:hypothetical protein
MIKTRVLLTMAAVALSLLATNRSLLSFQQPDPGGCDMQFLSGTTPTIDGKITTSNEWDDAGTIASGGCIDALPDGSPANLQIDLPAHAVTIRTKRDATNLYLAFTVADATPTTPGTLAAGGQSIAIGDRIVILFDPNLSGGNIPQATDFRLECTLYRNAPGQVDLHWSTGSGVAANPWSDAAVPAGIKAVCLSSLDLSSYVAEIQVPLAALNYVLTPRLPKDIGIAVAVINDLNAALPCNLQAGPCDPSIEAATGTAFPNLPNMKVIDNNHILLDPALTPFLDTTPWDTPGNWGRAFLAGVGDEITISRSPVVYRSSDIRVSYCPFDFANAGVQGTANWYRYNAAAPYPLYLDVQIHRMGGVGMVNKRLVALWTANGMNPQSWFYITLTDPFQVPPSSNVPVGPLPGPNTPWTGMPANQTVGHPCLQVFILPEDLTAPNPTSDATEKQQFPLLNADWFKLLGGAGETLAQNQARYKNFIAAYGIPDTQWAQMNLDEFPPTTPNCPQIKNLPVPPGGVPAPPGLGALPLPLRRAAASGPAAHVTQIRYQQPMPPPAAAVALPRVTPAAAADFMAFGVPHARKYKRVSFIEPLGGVQEAVDISYLKQKGIVQVHFNVTNSNDYARRIVLSTKLTTPPGEKGIGTRLHECAPEFRPGERKTVTAEIGFGLPTEPIPPVPGKGMPAVGGPAPY